MAGCSVDYMLRMVTKQELCACLHRLDLRDVDVDPVTLRKIITACPKLRFLYLSKKVRNDHRETIQWAAVVRRGLLIEVLPWSSATLLIMD